MKYVIANWKMNIPEVSIENYIAALEAVWQMAEIIIAPPVISLAEISLKSSNIKSAAQDISHQPHVSGPYTGEISAFMLKKYIKYAIIGHSERRIFNKESDEQIHQKILNSIAAGIKPIICIGETIEYRTDNSWQSFLQNQINMLNLDKVAEKNHESIDILIAYEPIWSIGTGKVATFEQIIEATELIKNFISKVALNIKIVYGGSVNMENVSVLSSVEDLSGVLVGKSSLNPKHLVEIIKNYA
ncbi:MAG: triose-phosphate isomerase [Rickettsiaceae bacterium]|nr:triose-phosphate isomerase [Rickettsiaceae bacterium]